MEALTSEIENIQFTLSDYSNWDETYTFVQGGNADYAEVNLRPESLKNIRMDIVEVYGLNQQPIYSGGYDKDSKDVEAKTYGWHFRDFVNSDKIKFLGDDNSLSGGLVVTPDGMVMYAARPILKSDGSGPSVGVFFLDDSWTMNSSMRSGRKRRSM